MWDAAVAAAKAVDYVGVGTVEYLVDENGFYFLEMNTRLQVEHGVTELVTGLDLVGLQLAVASGHPLPLAQAEVEVTGHAVEVRLCAERPREDYRPTPGTVTHVRWPEGPGVRTDSAIESGSVVSPVYDSLVAKLMARGEDRAAADRAAVPRTARRRARRSRDQPRAPRRPCSTTRPSGVARSTSTSSNTVQDLRDARLPDAVRRRHAAAVGFGLLDDRAARSLVPVPAAGWRNVGHPLHADQLTDDSGTTMEVRVATPDQPARVLIDDAWHEGGTANTRAGVVDLTDEDGLRRRYRVRHSAHRAEVNGPEGQSTFALRAEDDADERGGVAGECRAPLPGTITKVLVAIGQTVAEGDGLVVLEAMKMEHTLRANGAGTVAAIHGTSGQQVDVNDLLVAVEPL